MMVKGLWEHTKERTYNGRFVSLATLSAECWETNKRPLRIAIDTPLAVSEIKTAINVANNNLADAKTEMNAVDHIICDFYFQFLHLFAAGVEPIFVFDGPKEPAEKGAAHPARIQPCKHVAADFERDSDHLSRLLVLLADAVREARDQETRSCEVKLSHVIPLCLCPPGPLGCAPLFSPLTQRTRHHDVTPIFRKSEMLGVVAEGKCNSAPRFPLGISDHHEKRHQVSAR
ncbi:hypothetical protein B0T14DRAFT_565317 [Immersiella caudata]|uniref:XPG N-terminal domain-containing protein n=1 Tax=Immersiella caudata TaxID=314043 RepID=A0AA39WYS1_9PEZI|nr:hypothetical protein B0T14DRAFT_565317 [Immersiella caudata]